MTLRDEYDPGTNAGMPGPVTDAEVNGTVERNPALADRLADAYDVSRSPNPELYVLIEQFRRIEVERRAGGAYEFRVQDDGTCTLRTISGVYDPQTDRITETNRSAETVPC